VGRSQAARIVVGQFTERGDLGSAVVATQPLSPKFDGNWMWMDREGRIQPRVTLLRRPVPAGQPLSPKLDFTYRTLALRMRDAQCENCHMPHNPYPMRRLLIMHTPAHAAGKSGRLMRRCARTGCRSMKRYRAARSSPRFKRALLESGSAFEALVKAAKDWEARSAIDPHAAEAVQPSAVILARRSFSSTGFTT